MKPETKRRRRTCADRMRRDLAERQRQRRGGDPAGRVMLQLLGVLSAALALLPPMPELSFPFGRPSRRAAPVPSREGIPAYLDDDDRGPTAYAMERGIDVPFCTSSRAAPSWSRLVKDCKRRSTGEKARALLEQRVPPAAVDWLRSRILMEDWWALRRLGRDGATDDEIAAAALGEALKWEAAQPKLKPDPAPEPAAVLEGDTPDDDPDARGPKP